ncbi:MAG: flagellar basal body P-ring formation protein FlgA [Geminicoccaceae bacterium]|jgi:flagella basal body P-ring formation protein FlgA|nr:flagellar basal body P-ring formation protein FlgA [Geminicoccaceae bacterium]HRY27177.1 flagellar basal body P-ring formation chaperone FlgA [Geminicoccaceae bacterium]
MTRHPGTICAPALRLWPLAAWLAVAWLAAPALAASWLVPGEPLTEAHLAALVEAELPPHGDGFELSFTSPSLPLTNPAASRASLELVDLRFDLRSERFVGGLLVRLETGEQRILDVGGRAQVMAEVMVPTRPVAAGERLDPAWLEPALVPARLLRADALGSLDELDGTEARRRLAAGRPIRQADVQPTRLVRRGETVELRYRAPGIELVTLGRALEDGARGAFVQVANLDSERQLVARVVGSQLVEIAGRPGIGR